MFIRFMDTGKRSQSVKTKRTSAQGVNLLLDTAVIVAAVYLMMYLAIALLRIGYPFELEWMEGGAVDHVARVLNGQAIYVRPSIDFVPYIYTPLYYYLCAPLASVTGIGFLPLRLISLLSSLSCFFLLFIWGRRETGNWRYGLIAAGLYAASFRLCGAWFDIARADPLFILFVLCGAYVLRFAESKTQLAAAAVLLWLSFLTKQTAQFICVPLILYALIAHHRRGLWFAGMLAGLVAASILVLDRLHDRWFTYYIFHLPSLHKWDSAQFLGFWINDALNHFPILLVLGITTVVFLWRQKDSKATFFYLLFGCGCIATSWSSRLFSGGYDNALMPTVAALAVAMPALVKAVVSKSKSVSSAIRFGLPLVLLVQFAMFWYNPAKQIPSDETRQSGLEIIRSISQFSGDVYMPYHGFVATLAGKKAHAHQMAMKEVTQYDTLMAREITEQLDSALSKQQFSLVVLDSPWPTATLQTYYRKYSEMPSAVMSFWPVTGFPTRPRFWYVPRG